MNFGEMLSELKFIVNFNDGTVDQDFSEARLKKALNSAYRREYLGATEVSGRVFSMSENVTWASGESTLTLPASILAKTGGILAIEDITDDTRGILLEPGTRGSGGGIEWLTRDTLYWSEEGPGSDRTIRFTCIADPVEMVLDSDIPDLIPASFHDVIVWSAAVFLRQVADEEAPGSWLMSLDEWQNKLYKALSRGEVRTTPFWSTPRESDFTGE